MILQTNRFSTITKYFKKYRRYLIFGGVAILASNALILVVPKITGEIIDHLKAGASQDTILKLVLLTVGLAFLSGFFRFLTRRTIIWMSRYIEFDLRAELFAHLLRLSPSFYHQSRTGDIMARMTNDLEAVRQLCGPAVMYSANAVVTLIIGITWMMILSPKLTIISMIPLILMPVAVNRVANLIHVRQMRIQEHFSDMTTAAQENLAGIRVVKAYRQEEAEISYFSELSGKYIHLNMSLARLQGLFFPLMRMIAAMSYLLVFYIGGMAVIDGTIGLGTVIAFFGYLAMLHWPVIAVGWVLSLYQRGTASLDRINNILRTEPEITNSESDVHRGKITGEIEFRNLNFGYNGTRLFDKLNLKIEAGQTVGLVGQTGSGKTSLVNLIARLHKVDDGQLFIDGVDINKWDLQELRRQIGFAPQEPFLFSATIEENIRFGKSDANDEDIRAVGRVADLAKDVEGFEHGWKTIVGERGITLSGGQKQRTAIARAVIGKPSILILDDATSSVDTETEHEINMQIKSVLDDCTAIIISHRVSSVKDADLILYLKEGKIAEEGDHETLLAMNGLYAELYRSQLLQEKLEQL